MKKIKLIAIIIVLFMNATLFVKVNAIEYKWNQRIMTTIWNADNGLPSNSALAILQSKDGYMWIGTYDGLIRFDGRKFQLYNRKSDDGFESNSARDLYEDSSNRLWIGTNGNGLAVYDQHKFHMYTEMDGLPSNVVRCIMEDKEKNIWVGTTQGLAVIKDGKIETVETNNSYGSGYILDFIMDNDGVIWLLMNNNKIYQLKDNAFQEYDNDEIKQIKGIQSLFKDSDHNIWLGTSMGHIYQYDSTHDTLVTKSDNYDLYSINGFYEDSRKNIWYYSDTGIGYYDKHTDTLLHITESDGLLNNSIQSIYEDKEHNLWITSAKAGIQKFSPSKFININESYGLTSGAVNAIAKSHDNSIWIGTDTGLNILKDKQLVTTDLTDFLSNKRIRHIFFDSHNRAWISTYSDLGVVLYDGSTIKSINVSDGLSSNKVRTVYEDKSGVIWIGTVAGLNKYQNNKIIKSYTKEDGLTNDYIMCINDNNDGTLYLGTDGGGIIQKTGDAFINISSNHSMPGNVIFRITSDKEGYVYVTTNEGVIIKKDDAFYSLTTEDGLLHDNNFEVIIDKNDNIWFTSNKEIYMVNREELLLYLDKKIDKIDCKKYDKNDGLQDGITSTSWSYYDDNHIYLGTFTGLSILDFDNINYNNKPPTAFVDTVDIDGVSYRAEEVKNLSPRTKRIDIHFVCTSFINPDKVEFQYYLEGFDKEWSQPTHNNSVSYTNLPYGNYTFHLKAANNDGIWSEDDTQLSFVQKPYFYETKLFTVLLIVGLIIITIILQTIIHNIKVGQLKKQKEALKVILEDAITSLAGAIDAKDPYTIGHSKRVAKYSVLIGKSIGLDDEELENLNFCALMHDVGKIGVPDHILNKTGKLTDEEFDYIKQHPIIGAKILEQTDSLRSYGEGARHHHERFDGKGYCSNLKGEEISLFARIIAVADTYDAITQDRPYRKGMSHEEAAKEILRNAGKQFDPEIVKHFDKVIDKPIE